MEDSDRRMVELLSSITLDEINHFLRVADAERACQACGNQVEWFVRTQDNRPLLVCTPFYFTPDRQEGYFSLFCPMCGNTRFFNAYYVGLQIEQLRTNSHG